MSRVLINEKKFLEDRQGRSFSDVVNDAECPFAVVLEFFNDGDRQRRMEESEIHHDRPALAGVVRELESQANIEHFLKELHHTKSKRLRQTMRSARLEEDRSQGITGRPSHPKPFRAQSQLWWTGLLVRSG